MPTRAFVTRNSPAVGSASLASLSTTVSVPLPVFGFGVILNVAPPRRLVPSGPFFTQAMEPRVLIQVPAAMVTFGFAAVGFALAVADEPM